ncbi:hypothetical protein PROFUN_06123 [Planoprotostelium fungivorum]|uniref:FHA domain-containing protein n=1 Tax=Planoprotostelium fungivorum TaxID=1890364 RepID=A0A2P6NPG9_9EUKA|nr:hypothetical protein PROFUN_06123 [Planoprotostelium fungivorum]
MSKRVQTGYSVVVDSFFLQNHTTRALTYKSNDPRMIVLTVGSSTYSHINSYSKKFLPEHFAISVVKDGFSLDSCAFESDEYEPIRVNDEAIFEKTFLQVGDIISYGNISIQLINQNGTKTDLVSSTIDTKEKMNDGSPIEIIEPSKKVRLKCTSELMRSSTLELKEDTDDKVEKIRHEKTSQVEEQKISLDQTKASEDHQASCCRGATENRN